MKCDVENVLFYNLGAGAVDHSTQLGLTFERSFDPPPLSPSGMQFEHYVKYEVISRTGSDVFRQWNVIGVLCDWERVELEGRSLKDPTAVWWALKRAHPSITASAEGVHFGLDVEAACPIEARVSLASITKPVFDGVVSALHFDPIPDVTACTRLSEKLRLPSGAVDSAIRDESYAALGERKHHLQTWRNGTKWNPADDRCVAGSIRRVPWERPTYPISARLLALKLAG